MKRTQSLSFAAIFFTALCFGCTVKPVAKMNAYVGPPVTDGKAGASVSLPAGGGTLEVGLVLINDTTDPASAGAMSDRAKAFLTDQVKARIEGALPIRVTKILPGDGLEPKQDVQQLVRLAREHDVPVLLLAIFSGEESERPVYLSLSGDPEQGGESRGTLPGFETVNSALAEIALVDATSAQVIARSDGRAWARLNWLYVPLQSNIYPVIHRSLRVAPIYPPEKDKKDILRSIAGDEALEQAVMHLQEVWPRS